jgi:uncharacterized protein YecT (DUF1311 family)
MMPLVLAAALLCPAQERPPGDCWDRARTQAAINACAAAQSRRVEDEMNKAYDLLLACSTAANPTAVPKLKTAQAAWLAYRDAQLDAVFAAEDKQLAYGTVYPMCVHLLRSQLTARRTDELKQMLAGPADGQACTSR